MNIKRRPVPNRKTAAAGRVRKTPVARRPLGHPKKVRIRGQITSWDSVAGDVHHERRNPV